MVAGGLVASLSPMPSMLKNAEEKRGDATLEMRMPHMDIQKIRENTNS